jgi:hypothetical protein
LIGFDLNFLQLDLANQAMFNSKGEVGVSIDKELMGPTLSLNVQLVLDHVNAKHRAGIAMNFMT